MTPFRAAPADDPSHAVLAPRAGGEFSDWLDALAGPDPDRRRLAATSPGALVDGLGEDGAELPDAAVSALLRQVAVETDPAVRQAICTQLARHDQLEVVDGLVEHLAGHDAGLRTAVVDVLSRTTTSTLRRMPQLLTHPEPDVRILVVAVMAAMPPNEVTGSLLQLVRDDPHPNVVAAALAELAQRPGAAHLADLRAARERFPQDPFVAFTVSRVTPAPTPQGGRSS